MKLQTDFKSAQPLLRILEIVQEPRAQKAKGRITGKLKAMHFLPELELSALLHCYGDDLEQLHDLLSLTF